MKTARSPHHVRILHAVGGMGRGGIETWLMHILRRNDRERFRMDFMVHTAQACAYDDEIRALGSRILPCLDYNRPWRYAKNFSRLVRMHGPYDIVHGHLHHYNGYTLRLAERMCIPVRIAHSHCGTSVQDASPGPLRSVYLSTMKRWIHRFATIGLAASGKAAEALFCPRYRTSPLCKLLYYGIDLDPFREHPDRSLRAALGLAADAFVLAHVGRFDEQKNHGFLLEIFRTVAKVEPSARLLLIGDGPLRTVIERRAAETGLAGRIVFAGARCDVPRLLLGAVDVFVMPSLYEGLPLAGLEAQAAGLRCVFADSITTELDVVPQLITRLSLSQSRFTWARAILAGRRRAPPVTRDDALAVMERSPFNIRRSTAALAQLYQTATSLPRQGPELSLKLPPG
ncbi:MAG: glycosyltransferase [Verrucomicrobia bacterium]|nr:glycosyltransferase [Verrucomicrobiota bacterium]